MIPVTVPPVHRACHMRGEVQFESSSQFATFVLWERYEVLNPVHAMPLVVIEYLKTEWSVKDAENFIEIVTR